MALTEATTGERHDCKAFLVLVHPLITTPTDPSRTGRRRPFTTWVKKLTQFKGGASGDGNSKRHLSQMKIAAKKHASKNNNPYPLSGRLGVINNPDRFNDENLSPADDTSYFQSPHRHSHHNDSHPSFASRSAMTASATSLGRSRRSSVIDSASEDGRPPPTAGAQSMAPTMSTDHDAQRSIVAPSNGAASSITGTSRTLNGAGSRRGGDSTFSSPAPSMRSLTTTLTTIQSLAPGGPGAAGGGGAGGANGAGVAPGTLHPGGHGINHQHNGSLQSNGAQIIQFYQPFPNTPASAIPSHLTPLSATAGPGHPTTYSAATANNLLTDNASILTLASSSKRRRRRSLDTDASVRALAPSSLFGGSHDSLPLSVLSTNFESVAAPLPTATNGGGASGSASISNVANGASGSASATPGLALHKTSSRMSVASGGLAAAVAAGAASSSSGAGAAAAERSSIYSATGILGGGDRNSFYARQSLGGGGAGMGGDGASIRSGRSGRSGLLGHGRSESITGSIGGSLTSPTSPLASPPASPREPSAMPTSMTATITGAAAVSRLGNGEASIDEAKERDEEM